MSGNYYDGGSIGLLIGLAFFWLIFAVGAYVLTSWFLMKIFDKAGVQGRWRAWVPVYNYMVFSKLGDLSPWLVLYAIGAAVVLSWIPVIGQLITVAAFLVTLLAAWRVGLKLQKEAVWVVLYVFLSVVWLGINAFDKSRWNTAVPAAPWAGNGFLGDRTVWQGVPSQVPAGGYPANPVTQPGYPAPQGYQPPAPQGYAPPQGYQPPAPQGYQPPAPQGYQPPAPQGYAPPPAAAVPPVTPPAPPAATPPAPSADYQAPPAYSAPEAAAPAPSTEPPAAEPPAAEPPAADGPAIDFGEPKPDSSA